jgi:hypothetical protein
MRHHLVSVQPTPLLPIPSNIQAIQLRTTTLGADATPKADTLKALFLLLFSLILTASKAQVARSNRAGQAKGLMVRTRDIVKKRCFLWVR